MRYYILILFFVSSPLFIQNTAMAQSAATDKPVLIRSIELNGFVLGDKERFVKLFKPYRNKHLTVSDMNAILQQIQMMYEREGYQELVSIGYKVTKHRLVFTALMTS